MSEQLWVRAEREPGILQIILDRPDKRNALHVLSQPARETTGRCFIDADER